jgi:transposase
VQAFFEALPPCLGGMEACASAHHWARELNRLGHRVRLVPPQYVRPFVKTNKNDVADAEAICEAIQRPTMRFVPAKSIDQQAVLTLHRSRDLLVRQRTMLVNALRGHCAEFGLIGSQGRQGVQTLIELVQTRSTQLPELAQAALGFVVGQIASISDQIKQIEIKLRAWHRQNSDNHRLATIPGVGLIVATALSATIGSATQFKSGRQLAAWIGLIPRQFSTGGKPKLGGISKRGDGVLTGPLAKLGPNGIAGSELAMWYEEDAGRRWPRRATPFSRPAEGTIIQPRWLNWNRVGNTSYPTDIQSSWYRES